MHVVSAMNARLNCNFCKLHKIHIGRATETKIAYKIDSEKINCTKEAFFSVDLQKVIMLPRLPGVKTVAFIRPIIAYNETYAPLCDKNLLPGKTAIHFAITWHEAKWGRSSQMLVPLLQLCVIQ